jgi:hypothetical protein
MGWQNVRPDLMTDRHAINAEQFAQSVIRLDERAHRVASATLRNDPGRSAGAAFELVANHAGTTTHVTLCDRLAAYRGVEGQEGVLHFKWKALNIAEPSVISLGDDRKMKLLRSTVASGQRAYRVTHDADLIRVRDGALSIPCSATQGKPVISSLPLNEKAPAKT